MKKNLRAWSNSPGPGSQKGAVAVEFAIILPILILLLFGIIEFSLFVFNQQVITNASREGARAGIVARPVRMSNTDIETVVRSYCEQYLITFGNVKTPPVVTLKPVDDDLTNGFDADTHRCVIYGCNLQVQVDFNYEFLFLKTVSIGAKNIRAVAQMRME